MEWMEKWNKISKRISELPPVQVGLLNAVELPRTSRKWANWYCASPHSAVCSKFELRIAILQWGSEEKKKRLHSEPRNLLPNCSVVRIEQTSPAFLSRCKFESFELWSSEPVTMVNLQLNLGLRIFDWTSTAEASTDWTSSWTTLAAFDSASTALRTSRISYFAIEWKQPFGQAPKKRKR